MSEEIKILLVEDEPIWVHLISLDLQKFGYTLSATATNFEDAVYHLNNTEYDLVLLDISLNEKNIGIEIGSMINKLYKKPFIYLTSTSDDKAAAQAIATHPSAFLLKPANAASLFVAIQNAFLRFSNNTAVTTTQAPTPEEHGFFFVKQGDKYKKINWNDVVYLRSDKNYTLFLNAVDNTEYSMRSSLSRTLKTIIPAKFQRSFAQINRSEAVQLSYVVELKNDTIVTKFGQLVVTESYFAELRHVMQVVA